MKKPIKINSNEWCDFVFEDKNKAYGAYEMRTTSTKRHLIALGIVVLFTVLIAFLPFIMGKVSANTSKASIADGGDRVVSEFDFDKPEKIVEIDVPEPPKINREEIVNSIRHTPPIIGEDESVPDDIEVNIVDEIINDTRAVGWQNVDDGTDDRNADLLASAAILTDDPTKKTIKVVAFAEVMPQFPGGEIEMMRYIKDNLNYPIVDQETGRQGRVILRFVVTRDGNIEQVEVQKGVSPSCDREAIRVVRSMPKWIPGKQNGVTVPVYFTLPVLYRLM